MRYFVTFPTGEEIPVEVDHLPTGELSVVVNGRRLAADAVLLDGTTSIGIDHKIVDLWMEGTPPGVGVIARKNRFYAKVESERMRALAAALGSKGAAAGAGTILSPMPGRVLKVLVAEGDTVEAGAALVVVEAMKMENELVAQRAGTVKKIHVTPGQNVESGAKLIEVG
ncbi:MAG: acetyl-CoA carboxylase biotin carboxyl carrier protein subunit [Minicystis sp.]